jgi:hypothetical protein
MTIPSSETRFLRKGGLSVTEVEDDIFIVIPETEDIFHLNNLGRALWALLAEPSSAAELADAVAEAFPGEAREKIARDIADFLDKMTKQKLVTAAPKSS